MRHQRRQKKHGAAREFQSYRNYREFASSVARRWRYSRTPEDMAFLQTVLETSPGKEKPLPVGSIFCRAQIGHDWYPEEIDYGVTEDIPCPFAPERMKPLPDGAHEGRANAKGIPCLYVSTHEITAICEVRPWVGAYVSVAQMRVNRKLRVMDCAARDRRLMVYFR